MDDLYIHKMAKAKIDTLKMLDIYIKIYEEMPKDGCVWSSEHFARTLKGIRDSLDR